MLLKVALAQFAKDREPIESAYEARYLELCEELQEYVSSFQDSMKETQSNLEGAREELTDMKRVVEMNSQPIEQVQESKDEVRCSKEHAALSVSGQELTQM